MDNKKYPRVTVRLEIDLIEMIDEIQNELVKDNSYINSRSACIRWLINKGILWFNNE